MDNGKVAKRYAEAVQARDLNAMSQLQSPDVEVRYPQSGEVFRGRDNFVTMLSNFPSGLPTADVQTVSGDQGTVVTSPVPFGLPLVSVVGSGDVWVVEGNAVY